MPGWEATIAVARAGRIGSSTGLPNPLTSECQAMTISVACPNGHKLKAKEKLAGKKLKCPKCGSVVVIPALEPKESDGVPPSPEKDNGGLPPLEELPSDDGMAPLGDLPSEQEFSALAEAPTTASLPVRRAAKKNLPVVAGSHSHGKDSTAARLIKAPSLSSGQPDQSTSEKKSSGVPPLVLWGAGAGGLLVGLLLVLLVGWMIFGGDDEPDVAVAENPPAAQPNGPQDTAADKPRPDAPPKEKPSAPVAKPKQEAEPTPTLKPDPVEEPKPDPGTLWDLVAVDCDRRMAAFQLPAPTWAAAYDGPTGRVAVTHDEQGILLYSVDDLLAGRLSPAAEIATAAVPTAVCQKTMPGRRVWVVAEQDAAKVRVFDADSLQELGEVTLEDLVYVNFLTASPNPDDPFVYYVTQQNWKEVRDA